jgi:glutaminyl-tRNA synthetase
LSKRKLAELVETNEVDGWDDPRMPTLSGMRNRGYPASTVQDFCQRVGITKKDKSIEMALLENSVREKLDVDSPRIMAVLNPLKVTIENYPDDVTEELDAKNHPKNPEMGHRSMMFNKEIFIEHH